MADIDSTVKTLKATIAGQRRAIRSKEIEIERLKKALEPIRLVRDIDHEMASDEWCPELEVIMQAFCFKMVLACQRKLKEVPMVKDSTCGVAGCYGLNGSGVCPGECENFGTKKER